MSGVGYYGCKRDTFDHRDHRKVYDMVPSYHSHPQVDLRKNVVKVYDQGNLGSCTANALCAAYTFDLKKKTVLISSHDLVDPSRLFLYYNALKLTDTIITDSGCSIREALKAFKRNGVCQESDWPYNPYRLTIEPSRTCYGNAKGNVISEYKRIVHQDVSQFRACLKEGYPFVFGFEVFTSFDCSDNQYHGQMPMPTAHDEVRGSHAVMAVGYNDNARQFIILNSWGDKWGDKGYFYMPYDFIQHPKYCFDFWKITFAQQHMSSSLRYVSSD